MDSSRFHSTNGLHHRESCKCLVQWEQEEEEQHQEIWKTTEIEADLLVSFINGNVQQLLATSG